MLSQGVGNTWSCCFGPLDVSLDQLSSHSCRLMLQTGKPAHNNRIQICQTDKKKRFKSLKQIIVALSSKWMNCPCRSRSTMLLLLCYDNYYFFVYCILSTDVAEKFQSRIIIFPYTYICHLLVCTNTMLLEVNYRISSQ